MNALAESAGIACAISATGLLFAVLSGNSMQTTLAGGLLFASGVLLKMSLKP